MPAATNKADLLSKTRNEYEKLRKVIDPIDTEEAMVKSEDTSIKDIIAHRAHWIDLFLGWHKDGLAGKKVYFPAEGYKWNELKRYNADIRARQADIDWPAAKDLLQDRYDTLVAHLKTFSNADLYAGQMQGAESHWTAGRFAEAAGPSHFRSAAKYIRSELRRRAGH